MSTVTQSRFTKGLIAVTSDQSQPKGSLSRISNMVFTRRGALKTCDGSQIISLRNAALQLNNGPWTDLFLFQPVNANRYYIGILKDLTTQFAAITTLAAADGGAGGLLTPGVTFFWEVTALDGAGGETTVSNEVSFTQGGASHKVNLTWTAVPNAIAYNVYRTGTGAGQEKFLTKVTTNAFTDDGTISQPIGSPIPPSANTTQQCPFFRIPVTSYTNANLLATFPADDILPIDGTGGGVGGGGGGGGGSAGAPPTPQGGNMGNISPLPQIQQFAGLAFLALGNGFAPRVYADNTAIPDWQANNAYALLSVIQPTVNNAGNFIYIATVQGTSAGAAPAFTQTPGNTTSDGTVVWRNVGTISTFAIFNTFTAVYPDWQTATGYAIGDIIKPTANNSGGFAFKATQGGISGGAAPTFPQNTNATVTDNKIIWQNIGIGAVSPAPRGAAHAVVYAGSLWLLNTNPTTSADGLDGPNCLKMSDLNNPFSWNPLNVAFLSKDDGDVGTGLLAFTVADTGILSTSALFAFKNFKTFQILGVFGSSNFQILEMQTDMGCIASRSISFVPGFGGMRLTHLGVAVLDGIRDKLISDDIRSFLFQEPNTPDIIPMDWNYAYFAKAAQTANPPMYVLAIPLALNNYPLSTEVPASTLSLAITKASSGGAVQNVTWFVRATRFTTLADGTLFESDITHEVKLNFNDTSNKVKVAFGGIAQADPLAVKFRVYIGMVANSYTNYVELTPAQVTATVQLAPLAGFPNLGKPLNGLGGLTRLLCYDLIFKCWTVIDLPFAVSVLKQVRAPGTQPITVIGGFSDASVRRVQAGDTTWDGAVVVWKFRTPEVYGDGETKRTYFRSTQIRGIGASSDAAKIAITPVYNGAPATPAQPNLYILGNNQFHITADLLVTALNANETITGQGPVEIDAVAWEAEALASGVPLTFG